MAKWVGYAVSVSCGEPLGCYQGTILEADGLTITLTKAFRNGFPYNKSQVTINAADIKDLKIIEPKSTESSGQTHSTVAVTKNNKKCQKTTVCENLQAIPSTSGGPSAPVNNNKQQARNNAAGPTKSKPIDIQGNKNKNNNNAGGGGSYGAHASSTPRSRGGAGAAGAGGAGAGGGPGGQRRRNEACFGADMDPALRQDFDFEKNLALFDKQALWEQMRNSKPDLVPYECTAKFRHDENVLGSVPAPTRAIRVPDRARAPQDFVTDEGVVVPSVLAAWRRALWAALQRSGLMDAACVLLARATADVALRLVGGGRRLDPRNAHQVPTVVALVGPHRIGACGVTAARLLLSHGARTAVLPCGAAPDETSAVLRRALSEYLSCGGRVASCAEELPSADLLLLATHDVEEGEGGDCSAALSYARGARAALVCIEPPACGYACPTGAAPLCARAAVCALLPPPLPPRLGRLYLADVAPPEQVFAELGVDYKPPFGACSVLALHPNDDAA